MAMKQRARGPRRNKLGRGQISPRPTCKMSVSAVGATVTCLFTSPIVVSKKPNLNIPGVKILQGYLDSPFALRLVYSASVIGSHWRYYRTDNALVSNLGQPVESGSGSF